jgi:hypothetical protein
MQRTLILLLLAGTSFAGLRASGFCGHFLNSGVFIGGSQSPSPGWVVRKESAKLDSSKFAGAERDCGNWGWAAAVVDIARTQGVRLDQQYLIDRLYGGSVCLEEAGDVEQLAKSISHDYILPDGQKFSLQATFTAGAPTQPDPLIVAVRQGTPLMLLWRSHAYLLVGLNWNEYIADNGSKRFVVNELQLFDPLATGKEREVSFVRGRDNPDDLNGQLAINLVLK